VIGRGHRSDGGATYSTCQCQVRIKRRNRNSLKFSWTDTVGHACVLCGCLVNYVEVERLVSKFLPVDLRKIGREKTLVILFHERLDKRRDVVERRRGRGSGGTGRKRCRSDASKIPRIALAVSRKYVSCVNLLLIQPTLSY